MRDAYQTKAKTTEYPSVKTAATVKSGRLTTSPPCEKQKPRVPSGSDISPSVDSLLERPDAVPVAVAHH